jgi:hypothetical protein
MCSSIERALGNVVNGSQTVEDLAVYALGIDVES